MTLHIQEFLRNIPDALTALQGERYALSMRRHGTHPNLVSFKYNQIDSPMGNPMVQEARGIILDEANNWEVVAMPYKKFFNHGEEKAAAINWETAKVYEKLDGTCCTLYWNPYSNEWNVATLGSPDAGGSVGDNVQTNKDFATFRELFWHTFTSSCYSTEDIAQYKEICFIFELMTPENRVVVPHKTRSLILHGARNVKHLFEYTPETFTEIFEVVKTHPLHGFSETVESASCLNPMVSEGYVICDADFDRIKVKNPKYVAIAHIKDNFSDRRILELVRTGESGEFLSYYPEFEPNFNRIRIIYGRLIEDTIKSFAAFSTSTTSKKEFAMLAKNYSYSAILFALYDKKITNIPKFLAEMPIVGFERLIENFIKEVKL